jgi:hypothetical protein
MDGRERGKLVAALDAKGATYGGASLVLFAIVTWLAIPAWGAAGALVLGLANWLLSTLLIWRLSKSGSLLRRAGSRARP